MPTPDQWVGRIEGSRPSEPDIQLVAPLAQSKNGGSGAFQAKASDGFRYWVKVMNNGQGERVPITEQIVGRVGALIGAPCCTVKTIGISPDFAGWEFRPGKTLEPGIGHASLAVEPSIETRRLDHRAEDENTKRHAFLYALYDWCWGGDPQWLVAMGDDFSYHSHDHGWYFPPIGPHWTVEELLSKVEVPNVFPAEDWNGIPRETIQGVIDRISSVNHTSLTSAISSIPAAWPVTDQELEHIGFFLEHRAQQVASRIRLRVGGLA